MQQTTTSDSVLTVDSAGQAARDVLTEVLRSGAQGMLTDAASEAFEQRLPNAIDALYTARPPLGRDGMTDALAEECGIEVNPKRVRRLMKTLGLEAVYPRPRQNTSKPIAEHPKYPYLLRNLDITAPDQVWCADVTYTSGCTRASRTWRR